MSYLAELNIGRLVAPVHDPRVHDFVANLNRINALAERSKGFVWRLKGDNGNATEITFESDPSLIVNLSVWESAEDLEDFVWNTVHKRFYQRKASWFEPLGEPHFVMWRVEETHRPTVEEAEDRLMHLRAHGSTDHAFGWDYLPSTRLWKEQRCA